MYELQPDVRVLTANTRFYRLALARHAALSLLAVTPYKKNQDTNLLELPFETCQDFQDDFRSPPARAATTNAAGFDFITLTTEALSQ